MSEAPSLPPTAAWVLSAESNTKFSLVQSETAISQGITQIETADGRVHSPVSIKPGVKGEWVLWFDNGLMIRHRFLANVGPCWSRLNTILSNFSEAPVPVRNIIVLGGSVLASKPPFERVFSHTHTMTGQIGIFPLKGKFESHACLGLTNTAGTEALVVGFEKPADALYRVDLEAGDGNLGLRAVCPREDIRLEPGAELEISPLLFGSGPSLSALMDTYARLSATALSARHSAEPMTGWCSWYHYYGKETADDILYNARALAGSPLRHHLKVIQIDDGWDRPSNDSPRVWGDWQPGGKFPKGMKVVADEIHALGFQAGLWLAPFSVDPGSRLAKEHPEWLVRVDSEGSGLFEEEKKPTLKGLDLTHPEALNYLRETFTRVFDEWGFDYVKIDFLIHGIMPGRRHDPTKTTAEAFRMGMKVINECAGNGKFILTCGSLLGGAIGLCDGMRIGLDVGGRWYAPMNLDVWPHGNCSIRAAAYPTLFRQWMHGVWWQNDADCLIVRDGAVSYETERFSNMEWIKVPEGEKASPYGLSRDEAEFWVRAVWFTGGIGILSEVWPELTPERQALLQRAFPPHKNTVRWLDWYEYPDVCVLKTTSGPVMVGMFNISDEPRTISFPVEKIGGGGEFREWLSNEPLTIKGETATFPTLAPRTGRIWVKM